MSVLCREIPDQLSSTSALGVMRHPTTNYLIGSRVFMDRSSTNTSGVNTDQAFWATVETTTSGITLPPFISSGAPQKSLGELRRLSGLTWEQLAKLFNVSRRSLHFWASGQPLSPFNEGQLNRLLGTLRYIDRGSASLNRSLLLKVDDNGNLLFDLLVAGKYEELRRIVGAGNAPQKSQLGSLSKDAYAARMPQNPEDLVGALQDPVHQEVGTTRPAKTTNNRKNSGGKSV
jgi:transcriptional regulator with XRE-family HTH domain